MLQNYFKVALRLLRKNKVFSFINTAGLAIGISAALLITLYVLDELSYDSFFDKADRIYRLANVVHLSDEDRTQAMSSPAMGYWLRDNFPEVESVVRIGDSERTLSREDIRVYNTKIWYADSTLFDVFSYRLLRGNPKTALVEPYSIVLSQSSAKKFFGDEDPLGKMMTFSDTLPLRVTGLMADIPTNTHLRMDVILSRSTVPTMWRSEDYNEDWYANVIYTYVLLRENQDASMLEEKIKPVLAKQMEIERQARGLNISYDFFLQPITDIHLRSHLDNEIGVNGNITYVYAFILVAILVVLIACANYVNLSTARSVMRSKEVGMRKVVGAFKNQLVTQLFTESLIITSTAFILAFLVVYLFLPAFNDYTGKVIQMESVNEFQPLMATGLIFVITSIFAGMYPALFLSSFSPITILQNKAKSSKGNILLRKGLVIFQFSISIILITSILTVYQQLTFIQNRNLGLNKDQLIEIKVLLPLHDKWELIKSELLRCKDVSGGTATDFSYTVPINNANLRPGEAAENDFSAAATISADLDFIETYGIELIAGRNFSPVVEDEDRFKFIVNEAMVKQFEWGEPEEALGREVHFPGGDYGHVIGVVRNFNFTSLREDVKPILIHQFTYPRFITLKASAVSMKETLKNLEKIWSGVQTEFPFDYSFVDENFQKLYKAEEQTQAIIGMLAGLAIFIACLGLFGLAAFMGEQRTKEISIRKVLGADVTSITQLLSKDFMILVLVSTLSAIPISWYLLYEWLQTFAYRVTIPWWAFALAGGFALVIALFTVSYQSIKAAIVNPIDSLRSD